MGLPTYFIPNSNTIGDITNSNPAVVTTTSDHGYMTGLLVRIVFPPGVNFGMSQLNRNLIHIIGVVSANQFVLIGFNTTSFDPFDPLVTKQSAQVIPVGIYFSDIPPIGKEAVKNNLNISPEYSWKNTTFPWVNNPNWVYP